MVFLEAFSVFAGWNHGVFDGAAVDRIRVWDSVLLCRFCGYDLHLYQSVDLWGPCGGLALDDVYYISDWRCTASVPWHHGTVYEQDVHGSEGPAQIPY